MSVPARPLTHQTGLGPTKSTKTERLSEIHFREKNLTDLAPWVFLFILFVLYTSWKRTQTDAEVAAVCSTISQELAPNGVFVQFTKRKVGKTVYRYVTFQLSAGPTPIQGVLVRAL